MIRFASLVLALSLFGVAPVMAAPAAAKPDFTGVWSIADYSPTLKSVDGKAPPLTPAALATYNQHKAMAAKGDHSFDTAKICLPEGLPRLMLINKPFEILQRPQAVFFVAQNRLPRRAYFNETLPEEPDPLFLGFSVAKWEGSTLVVTSSGFRDGTLLDDSGLPHSADLKLVERYALTDGGAGIELKMTIEDPKTFTKPWTAVAHYKKRPGYQIPEEVCAETLASTAPKK